MKKILFVFVLTLLTVNIANAQTTSGKAEWDYLGLQLANVTAMNQVIKVDGVAQTTAPVCVQNVNKVDVNCSFTFTPALPPGSHNIRIEATLGGITKGTDISGLNPTNAPPDPKNFKYSINITINVGS